MFDWLSWRTYSGKNQILAATTLTQVDIMTLPKNYSIKI